MATIFTDTPIEINITRADSIKDVMNKIGKAYCETNDYNICKTEIVQEIILMDMNNTQPQIIYKGNIKYNNDNGNYTLDNFTVDAYNAIIDPSNEIYFTKSSGTDDHIKNSVGGKRRKRKLQKRTKKNRGGKRKTTKRKRN